MSDPPQNLLTELYTQAVTRKATAITQEPSYLILSTINLDRQNKQMQDQNVFREMTCIHAHKNAQGFPSWSSIIFFP